MINHFQKVLYNNTYILVRSLDYTGFKKTFQNVFNVIITFINYQTSGRASD